MPTLYDNFERVRQYIDQHQADVDLSSYVSKDELSGCGYLTAVPSDYPTYAAISEMGYVTNEVTQLDGPLFISYQTANNAQYTLNAYSHIVAGTEDKTGVSLVATKRKCGGAEGTSYMASFFTNSDGRSKFAHKTKISATEVGGQADDAFMCFNAYGFRIAYSGTEGVAASTEYEILHEGNIGNLGYITADDVAAMGYVTSVPVIDENIVPKETGTYTLGDADHIYSASYTKSTYFTNNTKIVGSASDITFYTGGLSRIKINNNILRPDRTGVDLGTSSNKWAAAYISNLYADTAYAYNLNFAYNTGLSSFSDYDVKMKVNGNYNYQWNMYQFTMTNDNYRNNCSLGTFGQPWAYTYTYNLILNGQNIENRFIYLMWVGTSAEYAALDNYTSYQIYLIQEA